MESQGSTPGAEHGPLGALKSGGSDVSPRILGISGEGGLQKCAGVQGCEDPVPEVGDPSGAVEAVLGGGRGDEERLRKPSLAFGIIRL